MQMPAFMPANHQQPLTDELELDWQPGMLIPPHQCSPACDPSSISRDIRDLLADMQATMEAKMSELFSHVESISQRVSRLEEVR